ncbi:hypothetical protein CSUI_002019, partial [Cystoisospora suis]
TSQIDTGNNKHFYFAAASLVSCTFPTYGSPVVELISAFGAAVPDDPVPSGSPDTEVDGPAPAEGAAVVSLPTPRLLEDPSQKWQGVVVTSFPKEACQHLAEVLLQSGELHDEVDVQFVAAQEGEEYVQQVFGNVVDVRVSRGFFREAHIQDLRVILGKELRHLLKQQLLWQTSSKNFVRDEAGLREQLGAQFSEALSAVKVEYERNVQQAGGGIQPISKISLTTVTKVPALLLEPSVFSPKVQDFVSTLLQYPRGDVSMDREQIELLVESHKQRGDDTEASVASKIFEHITDAKAIYVTQESKVLFLKILGLFWEKYYEYSRRLLLLVRRDPAVYRILFGLVMRPEAPGPPTLDHYGFASILHMLVWQRFHATGALALLQRPCRFLYAFGNFSPAHEFASRSFFLSTSFESLFTKHGGLLHGPFRPSKQMFSTAWYSQLASWKSRDPPLFSILVHHLTPKSASEIRRATEGFGHTSAHQDLASFFGMGVRELTDAMQEAVPKAFDTMFTSNHSPLRTLINMELKALHPWTRWTHVDLVELQRRFHLAFEKEKGQAVDGLIADLTQLEDDPNLQIDSLFKSVDHVTRILESPAFYTHDVLNSMAVIASVPEVSDVLRAIRITTSDLSSLNALLYQTPLQEMTSPAISRLRIYKPVGKQNSLRPSILNRLNRVFKATWTAFTRFFDNKVSLLGEEDQEIIRTTIRDSIVAGNGQNLFHSSPFVDVFDAHGFVTALALTALTSITNSPISVLDERNRLFRVSCSECRRPGYSFVAAREGFLHFSDGRAMLKLSGVQSPPLHVFGGLIIWEAAKASFSRAALAPDLLQPVVRRIGRFLGLRSSKCRSVRIHALCMHVRSAERSSVVLNAAVTEAVIRTSGIAQGQSNCTLTSKSFPECLVRMLLGCPQGRCNRKVSRIVSNIEDTMDRLWTEITSPHFSASHYRTAVRWRVLAPVLASLAEANSRPLTLGEQTLLSESDKAFLSSGEGRKAAYMLWVRFALKTRPELLTSEFAGLQSQLDAFSNGGPLQPDFVELLRRLHGHVQENVPKEREVDYLRRKEALEKLAASARKALTDLGIYAGTQKEELAAAIEGVATRNFSVVFDYVVKPEVASKFPVPFKEATVRCFISWWENVNLTERMLRQTEGIWLSPASPAGVKACLSQGRDLLANDASTGGVTPFVDAVLRSSYFHFHIFHRLRVVMEAAGTYLSLLRPSETRLSDLELQDLTASIRKLTTREFKSIIRKVPAFSLISYSIVAAETGRSLIVLEAPARSMHAGTLIRIGHQPRGLRRLLRRSKVNLVCAPDCHVVPKPIKLERNLTAEVQVHLRETTTSLLKYLSSLVPKFDVFRHLRPTQATAAFKLYPRQRQFSPRSTDLCKNPSYGPVFVIVELCYFDTISREFVDEALSAVFGMGRSSPLRWLGFWTFKNQVLLHLMKQAIKKQMGGIGAFITDSGWRARVPVFFETTLGEFEASLSNFAKFLAFAKAIRAPAPLRRALDAIKSFFARAPPRRREPRRAVPVMKEISGGTKITMVPTTAQIDLLPAFTFARRWRDFSVCVHESPRAQNAGRGTRETGRMAFTKGYRLAAAIGTSLRALEVFPSQGHLMYAGATESREVRVALNRFSLQYMIREGGTPYHSAKALIRQLTASAIRACSRRTVGVLQDLCDRMGECKAKIATRMIRSVLYERVECLMAAVEDSFATTDNPEVTKKMFEIFTNVFVTFKRRVIVWVQPFDRLFSFEGPTTGAEGALDIQVIVTRDPQGEPMFYAVAPGFPLKTQLELALSAVRDHAPLQSFPAQTVVMLDRFLQRQMRRAEEASDFEEVGAIIADVCNHSHLDTQLTVLPSGIQQVLGVNPENEEMFVQQTDLLNSLLPDDRRNSLVERTILEKASMGQLLQVCDKLPSNCDEIMQELQSRLTRVVEEWGEKAEASLVGGRRRGEKTALLASLEKLSKTMEDMRSCQMSTCSQKLSSIRASFKSLSRHVPPEQYRSAQKDIFDTGVTFVPERMEVSFLEASRIVRPLLTLPQWTDILKNIRETVRREELRGDLQMEVQLRTFLQLCHNVAIRRLHESLLALQRSLRINAPTHMTDIEHDVRIQELKKQQAIERSLNSCCSRANFQSVGPTPSAHMLLTRLRSRGYTMDLDEMLSSLTNNHLEYPSWVQSALNIDVKKMGENEHGMMRSCQEYQFWTRGARACTRNYLARMATKGFSLDTHSTVTRKELESLTLTYEEWMYQSRDVQGTIRRVDRYANAEATIWSAIAMALYSDPTSSWTKVHRAISTSREVPYLSVLGRKRALNLYLAVRELHRAVSHVGEKQFNKFGAYLLTDAVIRYLRDRGVFAATNSVVEISHIRQVRTFKEWQQKILLLKVSKEMIRLPLHYVLMRTLARHKYIWKALRFLSGKAKVFVLRKSLLLLLRLFLSWAMERTVNPAKWSSTASPQDVVSDFLASSLISGSVFLNLYLGIDFSVMVMVLPPMIAFLKSYGTKNMVETVLENADIPAVAAGIVETLLPTAESTAIDGLRAFMHSEALSDIIRQTAGRAFQPESLATLRRLDEAVEFLVTFIRKRAPLLARGFSKGIFVPAMRVLMSAVKQIITVSMSEGADGLARLLLRRPKIPSPTLIRYILATPALTDAQGLTRLYESLLGVFSKATMAALNPLAFVQETPTAHLTPFECLVAFGLFPSGSLEDLSRTKAFHRSWRITHRTSQMTIYPSTKVAITGFLGEIVLPLPAFGKDILHTFFIDKIHGATLTQLKKLVQSHGDAFTHFSFERHESIPSQGILRLSRLAGDVLCTLEVRFTPLPLTLLKEAKVFHRLGRAVTEFIGRNGSNLSPDFQRVFSEAGEVLPGVGDVAELAEDFSIAISERSLLQMVLSYEYQSQPTWFATDFSLQLTMPADIESAVDLTISSGPFQTQKTYRVQAFENLGSLMKLDETVKSPCVRGLADRITASLGTRILSYFARRQVILSYKCVKKAEVTTDANGSTTLTLSWHDGSGPSFASLRVEPVSNPEETNITVFPDELPLTARDHEKLRDLLGTAVSMHGREAHAMLRACMTITFLRNGVANSFFRLQKAEYKRTMLQLDDTGRKTFREKDLLEREVFLRHGKEPDPGWLLRLEVLFKQPAHRALAYMLGKKLQEFINTLAMSISNMPGKALSQEEASLTVSETVLDSICPGTEEGKSSHRRACEKRSGLYGSLHITDPASPLLNLMGQSLMKSPALFRYWRQRDSEASAKFAVGDLAEIQKVRHSGGTGFLIEVVSPTVVRHQVLVKLYADLLDGERTGKVTDKQQKYQLMKYMHISVMTLLHDVSARSEQRMTATRISLTALLREAGQAVINILEPQQATTLEEKKEWFNRVENLAEQLYRDLETPFAMEELSQYFRMSGAGDTGRPHHHLNLGSRLLVDNPFVSSTGYQVALQDPSIAEPCLKSQTICPHFGVLWNHAYMSLLIMFQLMDRCELLHSYMTADGYFSEGIADPKEPVAFEHAMLLFQYGLSVIRQWKLQPPVLDEFKGNLDERWIRRLFALFDDDETFRTLLLHVPPLKLKPVEYANPKVVLQKTTWNALTALWGIREPYGRFMVQVRAGLKMQATFTRAHGLSAADIERLTMPMPVRERFISGIRGLFGDPLAPGKPVVLVSPRSLKFLDDIISRLVPGVRQSGSIKLTDFPMDQLYSQVRKYLQYYGSEAVTELERLDNHDVKQQFLLLVQEALLKTALLQQLQLPAIRRLLNKRDQLFRIDNLEKLKGDYVKGQISEAELEEALDRVFDQVCEMIPASAYDNALKSLGEATQGVETYREKVLMVQQAFYDTKTALPEGGVHHHPLEKQTGKALCPGVDTSKSPKLAKACAAAEEALQSVSEKLQLSPVLLSRVRTELLTTAEIVNCNRTTGEGKMLRAFFISLMKSQVKHTSLAELWDEAASIKENQFNNPNVQPLEENMLSAALHSLALRMRANQLKPEMFETIYPTVCGFIILLVEEKLVRRNSLCSWILVAPASMYSFFTSSVQDQAMRLTLTSFGFTASVNLGDYKEQSFEPRAPREAVVVSLLRTVRLASQPTAEGDTAAPVAATPLSGRISEVFALVVSKIWGNRQAMERWNRELKKTLLRLVDAAMKKAFSTMRHLATTNEKQLESQRQELAVQLILQKQILARGIHSPAEQVAGLHGPRERESEARPPAGGSGVELPVRDQGDDDEWHLAPEDPDLEVPAESFLEHHRALLAPHASGAGSMAPYYFTKARGGHGAKGEVDDARGDTLQERRLTFTQSPIRISFLQTQLGVGTALRQRVADFLGSQHRRVPGWIRGSLGISSTSVSVVLKQKVTVPGSLKGVARSVCVNILDNVVLDTLTKVNVLAPKTTVRQMINQLIQGLHHAVIPDMEAAQEKFAKLSAEGGAIGLNMVAHALILSAATEFETAMQNPKVVTKFVEVLHQHIHKLSRGFVNVVKKFRLSDAICSITDEVIDAVAFAVMTHQFSLLDAATDLLQVDIVGWIVNFTEALTWREVKSLLEPVDGPRFLEMIQTTGLLNILRDVAVVGYHWYQRETS